MLDKSKNKGSPRPYLRNLNVRWFDFDLSDVQEMRFLDEERDRYTIMKGDLVICEGGYPGRAAIWADDEPIYFQKALHRVRFREPEHAKWFLYYLHMRDLDGTLKDSFSGTGIQHFTGEALAKLTLPLPSLGTLRRIVGILDQAIEAIAGAITNARTSLAMAECLSVSRLDAILGRIPTNAKTTELASLCKTKGITYGVIKLGDAVRDGVPCLRTSNVRRLRIDTDGIKKISSDLSRSYSRTILEGDEVLVAVRGTLGGVAVSEPRMIGWNVSREVAMVPVNTNAIDPHYVAIWIAATRSQDWLSRVKKGAAYVGINLEDLRRLPVQIPALRDQIAIVKAVREAEAQTVGLRDLYTRKLAALDKLKQSLLHQAFTGQL